MPNDRIQGRLFPLVSPREEETRKAAPPTTFTLGYEGRTLKHFIDRLLVAGIDRLLDVRAIPWSPRAEFSGPALKKRLALEKIEYISVKEAGNPYRDRKNKPEFNLTLYRDYLDHHPEVLEQLEGLLDGRNAALLCAEKNALQCHRSVLALELKHRGRTVTHL
jgi:uncharacterized protein (DUF488 family)